MIPGMHTFAVTPPAASIAATVAGDLDSTADSASRTHSNINVGASNGLKKLLLTLTIADSATGLDVSTFTVGGVAGTAILNPAEVSDADYLRQYLYGFDISSLSGSQAVVLTANQGINVSAISGVAVDNLVSLTPVSSATDRNTATGLTLSLAGIKAPWGGITIAGAGNNGRTISATWSALTERFDNQTGGGASDVRHTAAWDTGARASATETVTWSASTDPSAGVAAGFR